jgi:hypothetical protein
MKSLVRVGLAAFVGTLSFSFVPDAEARPLVGVRGGQYTDLGDSEVDEAFLGVELIAGITNHIYFNPNLEYVFVDHGKLGTGNLDFHVDFPVTQAAHLWLGAGLAVVYTDPEGPPESDTELGLNLLVGAGVHVGAVIPYAQLKLLVIDDYEELVWAVGVRF